MPSGISGSGPITQQTVTAVSPTNQSARLSADSIQVGKNPPVSLREIQNNKVPFAGFRTATKVERGTLGAVENGRTAIAAMGKADGTMDIKGLLGSLKTVQVHLDRLKDLGTIERCEMDNVACGILAVGVEELSNKEIVSIYQNTLSKDFSELKDSLMHATRINPDNVEAKGYLCNIINLEALVLQETGNRMARGIAPEDAGKIPSLTKSHGSDILAKVEVHKHVDALDMTDRSLNILAQTSTRGAINEARIAQEIDTIAENRHFNASERKGLGDVLRSAPLSMNVNEKFFLSQDGPLASLGGPWTNIFHLRENAQTPEDLAQVNAIKSAGYFSKREAVEGVLYPSMQEGQAIMAKERPTYAAVNVRHQAIGDCPRYGTVAVHLKQEVSRRATYMVNDSFLNTKANITPQKKEKFFTLLPSCPLLSKAAKEAISAHNSPILASIQDFISKLPQDEDISIANFKPLESTRGLNYDDQMGLIGLAIKIFGDSAKTIANMVDHDHIENLIPQFASQDITTIAAATADPNLEAARLRDCNYIEAQIHGELSLLDDVEEIVFDPEAMFPNQRQPENLSTFEEGRWLNAVMKTLNGTSLRSSELRGLSNEQKAMLKSMKNSLHGRTIPCRTASMDPSKDMYRTARAGHYAMGHYDRTAVKELATTFSIDQKMDEILLINNPTAGYLLQANILTTDQREALRTALIDEANTFDNNPASATATDSSAVSTIVKEALERTFPPSFLSLVDGLRQSLAPREASILKEQIQATPISSGAKFMLGQNMAKALTSGLQELMDNKISPTAFSAQCNKAVSTLQTSFAKLPESVRSSDVGTSVLVHDALLQSLASINTNPEAKQALFDAMHSSEMDAIAHTMASLSDPQTGFANSTDFSQLSNMNAIISSLRTISAETQGQTANQGQTIDQIPTVHPHLISAENRTRLAEIMPDFASKLEKAYPLFPAFPVATNPAALPQNVTERKDFLLSMLPMYGRHEQPGGYDRGTGYHGRGHICRAFIGAEVMAGIMERRGHTVDRAALAFGIVGHDSGRTKNGPDVEEQRSVDNTIESAQRFSGATSLGEAYATEIGRSIAGHQSRTLEGMLLNAADSLEIGRLRDFNFHYLPFLRGSTESGKTVEIPEDQALRVQLQSESQQLAVLTDPSTAMTPRIVAATTLLMSHTADSDAENRLHELHAVQNECRERVEAVQDLDDATIINRTEEVIRRNPNLFPLMTEFYLNTLPV